MKRCFCFCIITALFSGSLLRGGETPTATADSAKITIREDNGAWHIQANTYQATVNRQGYLKSIVVANREFLSQSKKIPGGSYLCRPKTRFALKLSKTGAATLAAKCESAEVGYEFLPSRIIIRIKPMISGAHFYLIINQAVKTVNYMKNNADVPTIAATPARATCTSTRWIRDKASLDITGSNKIWGPWKEHQVWDAILVKDKVRVVEIGTGLDIAAAAGKRDAGNTPKQTCKFTFARTTEPAQIPLCMIGDSITWAGKGDFWRKYLLENDPRFAFVGTHSAVLGFSHAGEGGNSTRRVLGRLAEIPDCPNYSLLIGTNDTGIKDPAHMQKRAEQVAARIEKIVMGLLKKKDVRHVFLCSILPCHTSNPLRDRTNSVVNSLLRGKFAAKAFPEQVVWVELEKPIRAIKNWEPMIRLHPRPEGYRRIAKIHATAMLASLGLNPGGDTPKPLPKTGVRVQNLWDRKAGRTSVPIIAGWYTISCKVSARAAQPRILVKSVNQAVKKPLNKSLDLPASTTTTGRVAVELFTGYEGYGYTRGMLTLEAVDCKVTDILFEKRRPTGKPSLYGTGTYFDDTSAPAPGELVEFVGK